ncbi:MAG: polyprenyl synthetase family protein, partial [Pirellulaceae bacterium]
GEIRQKGSRADFSLDEAAYLEILNAKTAELCACCCQLGAHYAGASESLTQRLTLFGRHLGVAFQIADDLLDVVGNETAAGKSLGTDLEQQKPTLPLIRALQMANAVERQDILALLQDASGRSSDRLRNLFQRLDVLSYTRNKAAACAQLALDQLTDLPESPAAQSLRNMAAFVVQRSF